MEELKTEKEIIEAAQKLGYDVKIHFDKNVFPAIVRKIVLSKRAIAPSPEEKEKLENEMS